MSYFGITNLKLVLLLVLMSDSFALHISQEIFCKNYLMLFVICMCVYECYLTLVHINFIALISVVNFILNIFSIIQLFIYVIIIIIIIIFFSLPLLSLMLYIYIYVYLIIINAIYIYIYIYHFNTPY